MLTTKRWCSILLIVLTLWAGAAWGETLDRIVAVVNGDVILYSELQEKVRQVEKISPESKPADATLQPQFERQVLNQIIQERLTEQEVRRMKIAVSDREVDAAVDSLKRENNFTDAQFEYVVQQGGQTIEQFRSGIKKELERSRLLERVLKSKTVITDEQVDAYLKNAKTDEGNTKERLRLSIIFLPTSEGAQGKDADDVEKLAREIHRRLKGGGDFAKLAKEYSKGPAPEEGGDIGYIAAEELAPDIASAVRGLNANDVSEVVKAPAGYYIVKVVDVQREKLDSGDSSARDKARRALFQREMSRKFEEWIKDLEARSFIQVSL